ncbi:MAG: tol-pal system protein YbgF [Cyclobacteriaceae bacterium]|nr:tol-pal system protein YbgF [Cyclobacteriaceae bacterium]
MISHSRWRIVFLHATLLIFSTTIATSQERKDSLLIADMYVQIEATQALNDMYNFKFREARIQFGWLKQRYHEHPLPYFLMGLNEWWKIMPAMEVEKYDETFLAYMDTSIMKAKNLYEIDSMKIEGAFFMAAAYGFKARLYSERKKWLKAAGHANKALNYLEDCRGQEALSPELLFGDGLYNYFSVWIPENYPQLRPFLIMFDKGNKELGLEQLREVAHNAFYTRTEAQYWLMRILFTEENDTQGAMHESEYLHETYPNNAYFQRYYTRLLFQTGRLAKAKILAEDMLMKVDSGYVGYEATSGRYATFYLARIWESNLDREKAFYYYKRTIDFVEQQKAYESGYYHYSLLGLAQIYEKRGNTSEAKECLRLIRKNTSRGDEANKRAKEYLKSLKDDGD